jgi:hypothetical protein
MKVRTMDEIQTDPARVRVTIDVDVSSVGTAAQANRIKVLEAELDAAKLQARGWDHDRHTERDRADKAQARVRELEESLAARDRLLEAATRKVGAVRDVLVTPSVTAALARLEDSEADYVHSLAWAVKNALGALDRA